MASIRLRPDRLVEVTEGMAVGGPGVAPAVAAARAEAGAAAMVVATLATRVDEKAVAATARAVTEAAAVPGRVALLATDWWEVEQC